MTLLLLISLLIYAIIPILEKSKLNPLLILMMPKYFVKERMEEHLNLVIRQVALLRMIE